jgi:trehalose/maltose hydrolase-like predicted phosphorylase
MSPVRVTNLPPVEPRWLREPEFDPGRMGKTESLFAPSNGHIGLRVHILPDRDPADGGPGLFPVAGVIDRAP